MTQPKLIKVHTVGSRRTVSFASEHINESSTARRISRQMTEFLEERYGDANLATFDQAAMSAADERQLTIDMSHIKFLSSVGLNELIGVNRQAKIRGVEIVLANVPDPVRDIFALTRLERMFQFSYTQDADLDEPVDSETQVG